MLLELQYCVVFVCSLAFLTPPLPVPSPDEKGGGLGLGLACQACEKHLSKGKT